jgi:hypothetical protein
MGNPNISLVELSPTLALIERKDGFWLWDKTRGMNLAVKAKSSNEAFTSALTYYQNRLKDVEMQYNDMKKKVDVFVEQFVEDDDH